MNINPIRRTQKRAASVSARLKSLRSATNEHFDNEPYDLAHDLATIESVAEKKNLKMEGNADRISAPAPKEEPVGDFRVYISASALLGSLTMLLVVLFVVITAYGDGSTWLYSAAPAVIAATTAVGNIIHRTGVRGVRSVRRNLMQILTDQRADSRRNDNV
ncbi:hypothetical protein ACWCYK_31350 [Streptomyces lydicamycinicus]